MAKRDLRDPQKLGEWISGEKLGGWSGVRIRFPNGDVIPNTILDRADYAEKMHFPDYESTTLGEITAEQYREELYQRAENGDKYAISLLMSGEPLE